jgi:signal transduction histidine kinase
MIHVELDDGRAEPEPDPETTAHLLCIANEALSNVARHSGATQASVRVAADPSES